MDYLLHLIVQKSVWNDKKRNEKRLQIVLKSVVLRLNLDKPDRPASRWIQYQHIEKSHRKFYPKYPTRKIIKIFTHTSRHLCRLNSLAQIAREKILRQPKYCVRLLREKSFIAELSMSDQKLSTQTTQFQMKTTMNKGTATLQKWSFHISESLLNTHVWTESIDINEYNSWVYTFATV